MVTMNIIDTFHVFQKKYLSTEDKITLFQQLNHYLHQNTFKFNEVLFSENWFSRPFFSIASDEYSLLALHSSRQIDRTKPVLLAHCLLAKLSHQETYTHQLLDCVTNIIYQHKEQLDNSGSLLGYAIGYLIGKGMFTGNNINPLIKLFTPAFIMERDLFLQGIEAGFKPNAHGLFSNPYYIHGITERYEDDWPEESMQICFDAFQVTGQCIQKTVPHLNVANEKTTWFFSNLFYDNRFIQDLHKQHTYTLHSLVDQIYLSKHELSPIIDLIEQQNEKKIAQTISQLHLQTQHILEEGTQQIKAKFKHNTTGILEPHSSKQPLPSNHKEVTLALDKNTNTSSEDIVSHKEDLLDEQSYKQNIHKQL